MSLRLPPVAVSIVAATVLAAFAFQWGRATAAAPSIRRRTPVVEAVAHAAPAVVSVVAVLGRGNRRGSGSGVIVHPAGYVVTNSHVIRGGSRLTVSPFGTSRQLPARLIADDPNLDLALLQISGNARWHYVSLCPGRDVVLGETAIAIGSPRGFSDSITVGVVSAKGRVAKQSRGPVMKNLIQTDASINSGNSGGPLLNLDGELIGINASMLPSAKGISFAIPSDTVRGMLARALGGTAPRNPLPAPEGRTPSPAPMPTRPAPRVGTGPAVEEAPAFTPLRPEDLGLLVEDDGCRLVIRGVAPNSPAAAARLRPGDILLEVDGSAVESVDEVRLEFFVAHPGRVYELRIRRGAATLTSVLEIPR